MLQLSKVDRLSTKLQIMSFIANFFDSVHIVTPVSFSEDHFILTLNAQDGRTFSFCHHCIFCFWFFCSEICWCPLGYLESTSWIILYHCIVVQRKSPMSLWCVLMADFRIILKLLRKVTLPCHGFSGQCSHGQDSCCGLVSQTVCVV